MYDMAISDRIKRKPSKAVQKSDFGVAGAPIDRTNPFYFGFIATLGALIAIVLMRALASTSQIFVLILVALFLATGLNPAVVAVQNRGMSRAKAVGVVFVGVFLFLGFFIAVVIPPVVSQGTNLINAAPGLLNDLKSNSALAELDKQFNIIQTLQSKLEMYTKDGSLIISTFGGVIGVGKSVISGTFTALTVLILTLYFITSLPEAVNMSMKFVHASRRDRITRLTNAVISRIGAFVGSQIIIAFLAAIFVLLLSAVLGLPSPFAIAMIVLVCGLVPLIGHFLGCGVVTLIALTQSVTIGLIAFVLYVVYVQIENYIVTPKIMKRTLNVPGAVTIVSALIGSSLLGLIGGLLAVPVAASIILILDEVVFPRADIA
jgi:predicted PurR-regulated permease PerM